MTPSHVFVLFLLFSYRSITKLVEGLSTLKWIFVTVHKNIGDKKDKSDEITHMYVLHKNVEV